MTRFCDIVDELIFWVEATFTGTEAAGYTPERWPDGDFTFVRVAHAGGTNDDVTDYPSVDVDVFSNTYAAAQALAEDIRQGLRPRVRMRSTTIDAVRTATSPHEVPWAAGVRRLLATYQLSTRR